MAKFNKSKRAELLKVLDTPANAHIDMKYVYVNADGNVNSRVIKKEPTEKSTYVYLGNVDQLLAKVNT